MKIIAYYHILLINNWREIVTEQLTLMKRSGLYAIVDQVKIGALGKDVKELEQHIKSYLKCVIAYSSEDVKEYEFATLDILHADSKIEKPFFGVYFHVKGVSFPKISGGKYWRDYMGHYNLTMWKDCVKKLQKGYDLCGVKLLGPLDKGGWNLHYSGNFFWFKSTYIKKLIPETNRKDRFRAEFWACTGKPKAATLCQMFVDYSVQGNFEILKKTYGKNYVHTLSYNLPSETEKACASLYSLNNNSDFKHYVIDLGFPLVDGDELPKNIQKAKDANTEKLKNVCRKFGSTYIKIPNIGVSQNWEQVWKHLQMKPKDVLIGADPDERPMQKDWVYAMGEINRLDRIGLTSLMVEAHVPMLTKMNKREFIHEGIRYFTIETAINWGLIGMTGEWMTAIKTIPYPKNATKYGWIEFEMYPMFKQKGFKWVILPDFVVSHTDWELNSQGSSRILRQWKNTIVHKLTEVTKAYGHQISLEEYIKLRVEGNLTGELTEYYKRF
jgi:hypothetical protein